MESQVRVTDISAGDANFNSLSTTRSVTPNRIERLPFTIRFAKTEAEIQKAVSIRHAAYSRHVSSLAIRLKQAEAMDFEPDVLVLLAESKLDGSPLGTMRLQTNVLRPLALESSAKLPARFNDTVLCEATRLGVTQEKIGRVVTTLMFKAWYMHCLNVGVDWMMMATRSSMDKRYDSLLMEDVFPERSFIPMSHVGNIPYRLMAHEIATTRKRWDNVGHPLSDFYFHTNHPDIDVDHTNSLPPFLDNFDCANSGTRHRTVS